jgi:hypothetical protein
LYGVGNESKRWRKEEVARAQPYRDSHAIAAWFLFFLTKARDQVEPHGVVVLLGGYLVASAVRATV